MKRSIFLFFAVTLFASTFALSDDEPLTKENLIELCEKLIHDNSLTGVTKEGLKNYSLNNLIELALNGLQNDYLKNPKVHTAAGIKYLQDAKEKLGL